MEKQGNGGESIDFGLWRYSLAQDVLGHGPLHLVSRLERFPCPCYVEDCCVVHFGGAIKDRASAPRVVQLLGGGRGCHKFVPVLVGDGSKISSPGDLFDQPPGEVSSIRGRLADHVGDHVVLSSEGVVLVSSPGTKSSYPCPPDR